MILELDTRCKHRGFGVRESYRASDCDYSGSIMRLAVVQRSRYNDSALDVVGSWERSGMVKVAEQNWPVRLVATRRPLIIGDVSGRNLGSTPAEPYFNLDPRQHSRSGCDCQGPDVVSEAVEGIIEEDIITQHVAIIREQKFEVPAQRCLKLIGIRRVTLHEISRLDSNKRSTLWEFRRPY